MSAQYDLVKVPTGSNEEKEELLYPRIVSSGTIDTETLIERISQSSTFTPGDLKGALQEFTHSLTESCRGGATVALVDTRMHSVAEGTICKFSAPATVRKSIVTGKQIGRASCRERV